MDFLARTLLSVHILTEHLDKGKTTEEEIENTVYEVIDTEKHAIKCATCGTVYGKQVHDFVNGVCSKCGYEKVVEEEPVKILPIGWYYLMFAILVIVAVAGFIFLR